jgi:hypothetical protein
VDKSLNAIKGLIRDIDEEVETHVSFHDGCRLSIRETDLGKGGCQRFDIKINRSKIRSQATLDMTIEAIRREIVSR